MANEILGVFNCPHCGNPDATIHKHAKNARLYYRCYNGQGSNQMVCGTAQIIGPKGQEYLKNILAMQGAIAKPPEQQAQNDAIAKPAKPPVSHPTPNEKPVGSVTTSFLDRFLAGDEE